MLRNIFMLAVLTFCSVSMANAQQTTTDKAALKAEKAAEKAAKKAAKEAEKEAKKALKDGKKTLDKAEAFDKTFTDGTRPAFKVPTVVLTDAGDSIAYLLGLSQAEGLKTYMTKQLNVDTTYNDVFSRGILDRLAVTESDKENYAYFQGVSVGGQIEQMADKLTKDYYAAEPDKKIDPNLVAAGVLAGLHGTDLTPSADVMKEFNHRMEAQKAANMEKQYGPNKSEGAAFLAENRTKPGVVELPSGLQYKVITAGTGEIPKASSRVKVNYEGHLINGKEFDSSYKRNQPATFQCSQVIKGWTEALCLMPVGSKWELYIPYNLAYGERSAGSIPPYSTLIFTVELLSIEK